MGGITASALTRNNTVPVYCVGVFFPPTLSQHCFVMLGSKVRSNECLANQMQGATVPP